MNLADLLRISSMIKPGMPPNKRVPLLETITTIINIVNIMSPHNSPTSELHHLSSRDNTSRLLYLPLEPSIQSLDRWNRLISPRGPMASANLPCHTINPLLILMVSQVLLLVHGFRIPVRSRSLPLVDLLRGCLALDRLSFTIPINKSDVGYLVELLLPFLCD
jgi:hypothetical protein